MESALTSFHPLLARWFEAAFGEPTDVQIRAWAAIRSGRHTLIAAPTGSGKTLAALLPCIDYALRLKMAAAAVSADTERVRESLPTETARSADSSGAADTGSAGVKVLYITPLKALNNDIHHHALAFAEAIEAAAADSGAAWPGFRAAVRTGDTTPAMRAAMLRRPPDMLITTPESLFILLTSEKGRRMLRTTEKVIVDEIHDLAADKRGAHLSLSLERLGVLCPKTIQRIGVSATQKPLERVARYLAGWEEPAQTAEVAAGDGPPDHPLGYLPRPVAIVESRMPRRIELTVTMPDRSKPLPDNESVWLPIMDRMLQLMEGCRSAIVFVNSRRLCERLTLRLNDHVGYELARSHHGSVARERRLEAERLLKAGELRVIVATSSLELGIDVGHVELVIQLDAPPDAAAGIQRIGRAGHAVGGVSRGAIVARLQAALPEIAVLSRLIAARDIEPIDIPRNALDVLSQHTVALAATGDWELRSLHRLISRSDSFREFPYERLEAAVRVLGGYYPFARPLLEYDSAAGRIGRRANSAMAALTGAGTIPQSSGYPVHHAESRAHLGELDEEFIEESRVGDVFQLGTSSWMIQSIRQDRVYVTEAGNRYSEIPFWRNEAGGRSYALGERIGRFWDELERRLAPAPKRTSAETAEGAERSAPDAAAAEHAEETEEQDRAAAPGGGNAPDRSAADAGAIAWLQREYRLDAAAAAGLVHHARAQMAVCEAPTHKRLVLEYYRDITGRVHVILHNHWGKRVNRTWLLAIERRLGELVDYRIYGNAADGGIELVLPEWGPSWLQAVWEVTPDSVERLLGESIPGSPLLAIAFRRIAETSLLLSRSFTRTPMWQKRIRSEELLKAALPYAAEFPFLQEAMEACLHEYLDLTHLKAALRAIADGETEIVVRETDRPSPLASRFAAEYATMQLYEGDELAGNVQLQLMQVSKELAGELFGRDTVRRALHPDVVERERRRLEAPNSPPGDASELYGLLKERGDLAAEELRRLAGPGAATWLNDLAREGKIAALRFDGEQRWICADERGIYERFPNSSASIAFVAGRYAEHVLSFTEDELRARYPMLTADQAQAVVDELLRQERIEQAPFAESVGERVWSSRKIASRLVGLSVREARQEAEPADPVRWLLHCAAAQHVLPDTRLDGGEGLRSVIGKLQGVFLPLSFWESSVFPARMPAYRKEELDLLCASGEVIWIGSKAEGDKDGRIAFFLVESYGLYAPFLPLGDGAQASSRPELLALLRREGAVFLTRLARESGKLPSELLAELLELVWEGQASNDQFAPLRIFGQTKGRQLAKTGSGQGRWYWTGMHRRRDDDGLAEADRSGDASKAGEAGSGVDAGKGRETGRAGAAEQSAVEWARHLLAGFGLVTKELVEAVSPYKWELLLPVMKRLEELGAVTRGMFVRDAQTLQFVSRELAGTISRQALAEAAPPTVLAAADPANPFGLALPWPNDRGPSYARKPGNYLVLRGGGWPVWIEGNGKRMFARADAGGPSPAEAVPADEWKAIFRAILKQSGRSKLKIEQWNGGPAADSPEAAALFGGLGAEREHTSFVLWTSMLG